MGDAEETRLVAWAQEMRAVHQRLRGALRVSRDAIETGVVPGDTGRDLLVFCHGFCTALNGHHRGEDRLLFPALADQHPELSTTLEKLQQDHDMIGSLVTDLESALQVGASRAELERHLEGVGAIMESHFRYEERQLLSVLENLELSAQVGDVFGPL